MCKSLIVDRTHLELVSGKLVRQKNFKLTVVLEPFEAAEDQGGAQDVADEDRGDADGAEDDAAAKLSTRVALPTIDAAVDDDVARSDTS